MIGATIKGIVANTVAGQLRSASAAHKSGIQRTSMASIVPQRTGPYRNPRTNGSNAIAIPSQMHRTVVIEKIVASDHWGRGDDGTDGGWRIRNASRHAPLKTTVRIMTQW